MLTTEERISLRDLLFQELLKLNVFKLKNNKYRLTKRYKLFEVIKNDIILRNLFLYYKRQFRSEKEALYCLIKRDDYTNHICPVCKTNICKFDDVNKRYRKTCCNEECRYALIYTDETENKKKQTNLERIGYEYIFQDPKFKQHSKEVNMKKLGVFYPGQSKIVQAKMRATNLKRLGCEYPGQSSDIQEKMQNTMKKRYGKRFAKQVPEIQQKTIQTMLNRYNAKYAMQSDQLLERWRQKYYINHNMINLITKEELNLTVQQFRLFYNDDSIQESDIYSINEYFIKFIKLKYEEKGRKLRLSEIANIFNRIPQTIKNRIDKLNILEYFYIQKSKLEEQFEKFLIQNQIPYKRRNRSILNDYKELDFYLPDYNIAFEINDMNSHNAYTKYYMYHRNKTVNCLSKGVELIHIWEWELTDPILWNRLSNWILNLLSNKKIQINESNYTLQVLSIEEQKSFLNDYNLKGYIESDLSLGVYYNNELIYVFSFSELEDDNQYELVNNCTKFGYEILNIEELIESIIEVYNMNSLITYYDVSKIVRKNLLSNFKIVKTLSPSLIGLDNDIYYSMYDCGGVISILFNNKGEDKD